MPSLIAVVDTIFSSLRSIQSSIHNARCKRRRAETGNEQPEIDGVPLQPERKRRKVQSSLCVNSKYINGISDLLRSDNITTIGIYGMGGIGKTTLAMQLYNQLQDNDFFSTNKHVIGWVSVELDFTVYQLQKDIAAVFGLDLEGDKDENRRAAMLHSFLSRTDKNCILFLDNLWSDFHHEDVGIPRNCKLIVMSRLLDVCRVLRCQEIIKVEPLTEEESWKLFNYNIGVSDSEKVCSLKKLVYEESAGLPLAITVLANSMMGIMDDTSKWRESFIKSTQLEDILDQMKLSFDRLNNIRLQHCFLYCALLQPRGYAIKKEDLIGHWIQKKLIDDVQSLEAQLDMGHSIINKLRDSCLLEAFEDTSSIKMHDLVRHMALLIARDCSQVKADIPSKLEFLNLTDTIVSSITSSSKPISQPLAKQPSLYACGCQHEYPLCSNF